MGYWNKTIEYRTTDTGSGAGSAVPLGKIKTDSTHSQETAQEETAGGVELYGGTQEVYEVPVYDLSLKPALRTIQLADGLVDLQTTDAQGNASGWDTGFSVSVSEPKQFAPRSRAFFNVRFVRSFV
tara:strand:- start:151065 stop:151442 length:378 start_codon:yes stop_codon:yes gene_type:complete